MTVSVAVVSRSVLAIAARGRGREDVGMISLGSTIERRQQVGRVFADVQLVDMAAPRRPHPGDQPVVFEADLLAGIEVKVADLDRGPRPVALFGVIKGVVGRDQAAVDRVPQMGQIKAAERSVPVGTVALPAIKLLAGDFQVIRVGIGVARRPPRDDAKCRASGHTSRRFRDSAP